MVGVARVAGRSDRLRDRRRERGREVAREERVLRPRRAAVGLEEVSCGLAPLARRGRCVVSVGLNQPQIVKSNQPIPVDRNQPIAPDGVDAPAIELRYVTASLAVRRVV